MSCGRHRRRSKVSSAANVRLHNQQNSLIPKIRSIENVRPSLQRRKHNHVTNSSENISQENMIDFDRFRILDDHGNDVTPRLITDYARFNIKQHHNDRNSILDMANKRAVDNKELSISEKSILATTSLKNSISNFTYTSTIFSVSEKTPLDMGTKIILESEYFLNKTQNDRISRTDTMNGEYRATFLPGLGIEWGDLLNDYILLSETETIFILDLTSHIICQEDHTEYDKIKEKNRVYMDLCKDRQSNDLYIERCMQTFNDLRKHKQILTDPVLTRSQDSWSNIWDLYDSLIEVNQHEGKSITYHRYNTYSNQNSFDVIIKHNQYQSNNLDGKTFSTESSKTYSSQSSSRFFSRDSLIKMTSSKNNCFQLNGIYKNRLPEIDVDAFIMERILNLNHYRLQQIVYRDINEYSQIHRTNSCTSIIKTNEYENIKKNDSSLIKTPNIHLELLWHYSCYLTRSRNVSCLCWNEKNHDLLAVGYGKFQYNNDREGFVCCWNAKNLEFPERYYETNAGVTSLSFSLKHPNLLAVGLFNGNICIYDLNQNNTFPIIDTNNYDKKHRNPVWQLAWNEQDCSHEINNIEALLSISSDGRITQWILRKEFEATDIMHLTPYHTSRHEGRDLKRVDETNIAGYFSKLIGGLCFDIRFNDKTIYLCGTDEGTIHRCSTVYNEKYLESYTGHIGPVYKVHWSPFAENIFLSAGADWTVRLWILGYERSCMIFPSSNSKVFFDAIWSPKSSTMFCCASENTIEIWDLSRSTFDPICIATSGNRHSLTSLAYAKESDCVLVGTNDGAVWVYHLKNLSSSANANDLITIVQQSLYNQVDYLEKANIHRETSTISTESNLIDNS